MLGLVARVVQLTDELTVAVQPSRIDQVEALAVALKVDHALELESLTYRFKNRENLETFRQSTERYLPVYEGWCAATLAIIRRETNTWRWPVFAWVYMTAIGYTGALIAFQLGSA